MYVSRSNILPNHVKHVRMTTSFNGQQSAKGHCFSRPLLTHHTALRSDVFISLVDGTLLLTITRRMIQTYILLKQQARDTWVELKMLDILGHQIALRFLKC
jgi:hypothetical protein